MNTATAPEITPILGTALAGGFYAGRIRIDGQIYALIVAPKADGEVADMHWHDDASDVPGALSYCDGLANTAAMLAAGSPAAQWARGLRIDGYDDWYLPSQDELEILYRNLKPTAQSNWCYARSGINLSAAVPTYPYTPDNPVQTQSESFRAGGVEAFAEVWWYWSSTQHASGSDYAWHQHFDIGSQNNYHKGYGGRARAVRRLPI